MIDARWLSITTALGFVVGLACGWGLYTPTQPAAETYAAPERLRDGTLVIERKPDANPPKAPHALPKGAKEERRVQVVVKPPKAPIFKDHGIQASDHFADVGKIDSCECPPVTVDLSLVRMPDKTRRVVASSPNGQILSGIDVPIESTKIPRVLAWAIGGTYSYDGAHRFGGFVDRDLGPFRLGVEAFQSQTGWTAQARAGIRF